MTRSFIAMCWACVLSLLLCACEFKKPDYPGHSPRITTTISSDGKLVAVLDRVGTKAQRLRIKWVDKDAPWQELPLPIYTSNIRFALKGYDLLISHDLPDNIDMGQITRWDISDLLKEPQMIRQGPFYAFPIEIKPGTYLVRTCEPIGISHLDRNKNSCQAGGLGSYWVLLAPGSEPVRLTPKELDPVYSQPNVTDQGFFWTSDYVVGLGPYARSQRPTNHPMLLSFPFPRGHAPQVAVEPWTKESRLMCDRQIERCLRLYRRRDRPESSPYVYDTEVIYRGQSCPIEGVQGYHDAATLMPDGRAGVIPVARAFEETRRVVVLRFKDGQCEPNSIQHLNFKEK